MIEACALPPLGAWSPATWNLPPDVAAWRLRDRTCWYCGATRQSALHLCGARETRGETA
jgi:hypothetical protein